MTIVSPSSSLREPPFEFATSLAAMLEGRYGLSLGNIIGSDIFNVLGVLGLTACFTAELECPGRGKAQLPAP